MHCVGEKYVTAAETEKVTRRNEPVTLDTASGNVTCQSEVEVYVYDLGIYVTALVMPDSPPLLSVGLSCKDFDMLFFQNKQGAMYVCLCCSWACYAVGCWE